MLGIGLSLTGRLRSSASIPPSFSPSSLFSLSEPGIWLDPSDVANLAWRRNLLTFTEQFDNAVWGKLNATITANSTAASDGTTTADTLFETTATGNHQATQALTVAASAPHSVSIYVKANGRTKGSIECYGASSPFNGFKLVFDLTAKTVTSSVIASGTCTASSIEELPNGWFKISGTGTFSTTTSIVFGPRVANDAGSESYAGDITKGLFVWGAQLELGSVATDYQRISDVNTEVIERFPSATLYQDTAGTQPVTTPGQTVALALDKSKGLVLGSEQIVNGSFSADTDWTKINGATISGGVATLFNAASNPAVRQVRNFTLGRTYLVSLTWTGTISAGMGAYGSGDIRFLTNSTLGSWTGYVTLSAGTGFDFWVQAPVNSTATVDNISVRELPGFHATQATAASRPTYGVVPRTGRRNLLTRTEEFDNAVWTKNRSTVTALGGGEFTLTQNATDFAGNINQTASITASQLFSVSVEAKAGTAGFLVVREQLLDGTANNTYFNLSSGTVGTTDPGHTAAITSLGDGWYRCSITATSDATARTSLVYFSIAFADNSGASSVSDNGKTILLRKTQYAFGALSAYQRVGSAFDVTEAGVASLSYLSFDGVDDFLITPTITPGIDKAQVFAGVRKLSDAASYPMVVELGTGSGNGFISLCATGVSNTPSYTLFSTGTNLATATVSTGYAAPRTDVLTGLGDIGADRATLRVNGAQVAQAINDQGASNYLANVIYIGRRGGSTLPFNGQLYSLLVRFGTNLDAGTITSTETWVNGKTGAYA